MKKKVLFLTLILSLAALGERPAWASEGNYFKNLGRDFVRGLKNVISSPLEIPITIQEYHEKPGHPGVRHIAGFFDGAVQCVERAGSGLWDFVVMWIPGDQEGLPPNPETLF